VLPRVHAPLPEEFRTDDYTGEEDISYDNAPPPGYAPRAPFARRDEELFEELPPDESVFEAEPEPEELPSIFGMPAAHANAPQPPRSAAKPLRRKLPLKTRKKTPSRKKPGKSRR
ncbi:MAG: hypothetical protein GYA66_14340, partial [Phyllobacteriaceae bacterium]|nr:hypothetical protein [Phyllobacteriaceae bacterium]